MTTNKQQSKVRFVRCPKCTQLLPEPEHVPVYSCGGCATTLRAKNYRGHRKITALSSHDQGVLKRNGIIDAYDATKFSGSSRRSSIVSDGVGNSGNYEQNGAANCFDNSSLSKESSFFKHKENGEIDYIKSNINDSKSEHNSAANSSENTSLSMDSSSLTKQENGEIDNKSEDYCSTSEHNGFANYSGCKESKKNGDVDGENDQFDSEDRGAKDIPTFLENNSQKLYKVNSANEEDNGQDVECNGVVIETLHQKQIKDVNSDRKTFTQDESIKDDEHEEKLVRSEKSAESTTTLTQSAANKYPAEHHTSDQQLPEKTGKIHSEGKRTKDDRHEQNQIENIILAKDASSCTESPSIEKPTRFASEHSAQKYASDNQQSQGIEQMHLVSKHSRQKLSRNEITLHELEPEVAKSGNVYGNGTDSIEDVSSLMESPELTQLASKIPGKCYAFDHETSKEASKTCHGEVHIQLDITEDDTNEFDANGTDFEQLSKENSNGEDPKAIVEQVESVHISSTPSLLTGFTQGENESAGVSTSTSVSDLKTFDEMGRTKVSENHLHLLKNSFEKANGASKQNIENIGERVVYTDKKIGADLKEISELILERPPACDGSISCDGNNDKVAEQPAQVGEESLSPKNVVSGSDGAEESPEWNTLPSERMIFDNLRASRQARRSSSMALDDKLKSKTVEGGLREGNGIPRKYERPREAFLPRDTFQRRNSEITYETGSTTSYALHNETSRNRMHPRNPYGIRFPEAPHQRDKEFLPVYYSETSGEFYDRPRHPSYMDRRQGTQSLIQSQTLPRNAYSAEMFNAKPSYMHRYPEHRRWSALLPPPSFYFHQGGYMNPGWLTRWDPYDSYRTAPQRLMEPKSSYAWGNDAIPLSDDPRHKDQIMRRQFLRKKREEVITPLHPIAGGTPFITCYFCFHILQIPQNFLISRRQRRRMTHKLKCGACSRVLEYSLENEGGLTPCGTNHNRISNMAISSHTNANQYRQSSVNSTDNRALLSCDSFGASNREKRKVGPGSSRKGKRVDLPPVRGRPPKVSSQLPTRSKSPLHKLMGYSSPNKMLAFHESDGEQ